MTAARPREYEVRVEGHLDPHWAPWLGATGLVHEGDGTTSVQATVQDQAHLHALLTRVRDLGVTLVSVVPRPDPVGRE